MKRIGNIYSYITHINNIKIAHNRAQKGKKNRKETRDFNKNYHKNIYEIQKILLDKTYKTSEYKMFTIVDKDKEREIASLPYFPDRVVHWALMLHVEELFLKHFISTTYAALPNKGVHLALKNLNKDIKRNPSLRYVLKLDIKKFFPNVDKEILKQLFRKKIKDRELLWLMDEIVDGYKNKGIPIGNYTSQYFGNYYLSFFDHWLKESKKVKVYHRYMDDMVVLGETKEELWELLGEIREYLDANLKLKVKENYQVSPIESRGVDFVGYKSYGYKITLRNRTRNRMIKKMNRISKKGYVTKSDKGALSAYKGILKYATGSKLYDNHIKPVEELIRK